MTKLEKVMKGLESCRALSKEDLSQENEPCNSCPYAINANACSPWELYDDALNLLKEQEETIYALQIDLASAKEAVEECSALIEEKERKKGEWIGNARCSNCGWINEVEDGFCGSTSGFLFCPHCGAKMH